MPMMPSTLCNHIGCNNKATHKGRCALHQYQRKPTNQAVPSKLTTKDNRQSSTQRGYDSRWRTARLTFLEANPLCVECLQLGIVKAADVVDHIIPHRGDMEFFWDQTNWQSLCFSCHNTKTTRVDNKLSDYEIGQLKKSHQRYGVGKK